MAQVAADARGHSLRRAIWRVVLFAVLAIVGMGVWLLYCTAAEAIQAEENLHATLFSIALVEQFVAEQGRWPQSWNELEQLSVSADPPVPREGEITVVRIGGQHGHEWPGTSQEMQQRVFIDFNADVASIVGHDPMTFTAIKPIGPYYEYRHYGYVESLQKTLTRANATPVASEVPAVEDVAQNYMQLQLVTKEPVLVDPQLAMLCVGVNQHLVDDAKKRAGPHAHTAVRIFMNDSAATAFRESAATYPVGSVIVKEKQGLEYRVDTAVTEGSAKTRDGVGGMIKRAPGYDPTDGDWEYFYFEDAAKIERGTIRTCVECHRGAAARDYVFGDWAVGD